MKHLRFFVSIFLKVSKYMLKGKYFVLNLIWKCVSISKNLLFVLVSSDFYNFTFNSFLYAYAYDIEWLLYPTSLQALHIF